MKIYVVIGSTGELANYKIWNVCAYNSVNKAKEHAQNASSYVDTIFKNKDISDPTWRKKDIYWITTVKKPHDKGAIYDLNGGSYSFEEIELIND